MIRYLDLFALIPAFVVFLIAGLPMIAFAVAGAAWVAQRTIQVALQKRAAASQDPRALVGITAGSMIARGWICAFAIFGVGTSSDQAGLSAALLMIALFTIYFTVGMILRPMQKPLPLPPQPEKKVAP